MVSCNAALSVHALVGRVFRNSLWLMGLESSESLQSLLNCVALTPRLVTQIYPAGVFFPAFSCRKSTLKQDKTGNLLPLCTAGCKACGQCSETTAAMKLFRSMQKDHWKQESWAENKDSIWVARTANTVPFANECPSSFTSNCWPGTVPSKPGRSNEMMFKSTVCKAKESERERERDR